MPFSLQVQPRMGEYTLAAAQSIAGNIDEWRKKREQLAKDLGESDTILDLARKYQLVTPEQDIKYAQGSAKEKVGIAEGLAKSLTLNQAEQHFQAEQKYKYAALQNAMDIAGMHLAASKWGAQPLTDEELKRAQAFAEKAGYVAAPTRTGVQYLKPGTEAEHTPGEPIFAPGTATQIGVWAGKDKPSYFRQQKGSDMAEMFKAMGINPEGGEGPKLPQATTGDKIMNFLKTGPMGPPTPVTVKTQEEIDMLPPDAAFYVAGDPQHMLRRKKRQAAQADYGLQGIGP